MPTGIEMFGFSRVRVAFAAAIVASVVAPAGAYGLAPSSTTTSTSSTTASTTTTLPATGPTTTTTIPGPPPAMPVFTLPTNSGLQLLQTMQQAKDALKAAQLGIGGARGALATARKNDLAARRKVKKLEAVARKTQHDLERTRTVLRQTAAEAYIHAGDAQLMSLISGYLNTTSAVEAGSQLHVLGTFGSNQKQLLDNYLALKRRVDRQVAEIHDVATRAASVVSTASERLRGLNAAIQGARTQIAVALAGIHDFQTAATSATSPILGPSRLTAKQMADYVVAQKYTPHITVPIGVLAQIYLDEGARTGVRGDVAFAQSILETGGFANPGSAATNNNFAGIGWCDSCKHGFDFPDAKTGVRAQLQLLRTYVDPSFPDASYKDKILLRGTLTLGFRGKVQTWWDLWGT
ncbi:MAG TPA: glucosaminidase domain-containing protein, partial [Acidimicrobiia bacterium]|nr:glucosaminidase domain-containing protein [Acidimicrobiia bacterium]